MTTDRAKRSRRQAKKGGVEIEYVELELPVMGLWYRATRAFYLSSPPAAGFLHTWVMNDAIKQAGFDTTNADFDTVEDPGDVLPPAEDTADTKSESEPYRPRPGQPIADYTQNVIGSCFGSWMHGVYAHDFKKTALSATSAMAGRPFYIKRPENPMQPAASRGTFYETRAAYTAAVETPGNYKLGWHEKLIEVEATGPDCNYLVMARGATTPDSTTLEPSAPFVYFRDKDSIETPDTPNYIGRPVTMVFLLKGFPAPSDPSDEDSWEARAMKRVGERIWRTAHLRFRNWRWKGPYDKRLHPGMVVTLEDHGTFCLRSITVTMDTLKTDPVLGKPYWNTVYEGYKIT